MPSHARLALLLAALWIVGCAANIAGPHDTGAPPESSTDGTPPRLDAAGESDGASARDATGLDASTGDAAAARDGDATGADAASTASRCRAADAMLCEDFETGALDATRWSTTAQHAIVTVDTTRALRGRYALHVRIADITATYGNQGAIVTRQNFPLAGHHLFVRAFVYIQADPDRWFSVLTARAPTSGYAVTAVPMLTRPGRPSLFRDLWFHDTGEPAELYSTQYVPFGRWACWEWEIRGATNEMALSIDDTPLAGFVVTSSMGWIAPTAAPLGFGYQSAHPEPNHPAGFDLWVDEIAVGATRVGCAL